MFCIYVLRIEIYPTIHPSIEPNQKKNENKENENLPSFLRNGSVWLKDIGWHGYK